MKWRTTVRALAGQAAVWACTYLLAGGPGAPPVAGAEPGLPAEQGDLATQVRATFSAKCAECHGPDLRKPRGKFGYVLDLGRVAANPKLVVPAQPAESKLWQLIETDEMPPEEFRAGPLTGEQKEVVRAWIEAGAPAATAAPPARMPPDIHPRQGERDEAPRRPFARRALLWLGRFHVVAVHFPIALVAAALGELWDVWRRHRAPSPAVRFCVLLAAASAVPVAALGWLHAAAGYGAGAPAVLALHRWLGTAAAAWAVGLAVLSEADARRGVRGWPMRIALLAGALLVGAAGHFGGILVHGEDFFRWEW